MRLHSFVKLIKVSIKH